MNLLIVDDEYHVVDWLYDLMERERPEIELYKAYSGVQAVSWLERVRMDVVLTDIRMPRMSGLQLMELVRGRWPDCQVIFLTGFGEFETAYKAIQTPGVRYLLKTEEDEVIVSAVDEALCEIERARKIADGTDMDDLIGGMIMRERALSALMHAEEGPGASPEAMGFDEERPVYLARGWLKVRGSGLDLIRIEARICGAMERCLAFRFRVAQYALHEGGYLWALQPASDESVDARVLAGHLEVVERAFEEITGAPARLYWKEAGVAASALGEALRRFVQDSDRRRVPEGAILSDCAALAEGEGTPSSVLSPLEVRMRMNEVRSLEPALARGDCAAFSAQFAQATRGLEAVKSRHDAACTQVYCAIALMLMSAIEEQGLADRMAFQVGLGNLRSPDGFRAWAEAFAYLTQVAQALFEVSRQGEEQQLEGIAHTLAEYIEHHLDGDLSLAGLSELTHYNPSYLSRAFKRQTGQNLNQYITEARIRRGCALLRSTRENVSGIAARVGFDSAQYFATVFKRHLGMTPQAYRDKK